jgi:hypothetical protein
MVLVIGQFKLGDPWRSPSEILNLIISHLHRYPLMEEKDVYVLLFQGTIGPKRLIYDDPKFEEHLNEEFELTNPDETIPLWENLRPDGEIVRFNLAPYKARGGDAGTLSTICLWTHSSFKGSLDDLKESWDTFKRLCQDGRLRKFDLEKLAKLDEWMVRQNYPPAQHSDAYSKAYRPAYRLVRREFLPLISPGK